MQFVGLASGIDGSLRKRRLTSPRSPILQKLPIGGARRLKDRREEAIVRQFERQVNSELQNQQQQCRERFLNRWHHIRNLYAVISEIMTTRTETLTNKSKLPPTTIGASLQSSSTSKDTTKPAPLYKLTSMAWLIDVAREFRQGIAAHIITMPQMEIVFSTALHISLNSARVSSCLRNVFQAFQRQPESSTIDYRELLSALYVLDRWREGEKKMVARWFHEFTFPLVENSAAIGDMKMAVRGQDLRCILFAACGDEMDEAKMQPFVTELLAAMTQRGRNYIAEKTFWDYSDAHPKLLLTVKTQCWKRLTDDTRLNFYRDIYLHAKERFIKEDARVRIEKALSIWRTREPRHRFARWKVFVACRKLMRRDMLRLGNAANGMTFVGVKRDVGVHDTWLFHNRRQKEVAAADIRGRQLQQDLWLAEQIEAENAQMEIEDKLSAAVAAKALASAERGRRRSFIEATDRVHANRKLQKQKEERIQYKASRERAAELEATQAWTAIREQVAVEVRGTTLTWLDTRDAKDQIQTEANRIFETDAKWIRSELERDPENSAKILPKGCLWKVFLEAPRGIVTRKLTKAFYLNTVTYEKHWCDEVVLEDCQGIAREVIIQARIDEALERLKEKQNEWELQRRQNIAATRIQMMFRCRQARIVCCRIIRNSFIKRIDPRSGLIVYFNLDRPQDIRRKPPKMIGSDESLISVESSTWVYRQDTHGAGYYERLDSGESSVGPPDHYLLCTRCSVNFVTRRTTASGARYCIGCYACIRATSRKEAGAIVEEESGWTKMPVQAANCMICRNSLADFICTDCNHDATCTRCFNAIHGRLAKNKIHCSPIPLVNRLNVV
ncbi:hypothetical protein F442_04532 [Phytophthora nicotianae P10297]|uniref:Uncharacterized protein n=1 Tax=Phytophthora nicotianae P10297 TaxID=1317064 RepID=W2ZV19_PHYNI|nr:hypothetical protein F442_04532 [Phytophthora nicotianae P10297]